MFRSFFASVSAFVVAIGCDRREHGERRRRDQMQVKDVQRTLEELKYLDRAFRLMGMKWDHARMRVTHLAPDELPYPQADESLKGKSVFQIKRKGGGFLSFRAKPAQLDLATAIYQDMALGLPVFIVILKARQIGFSTFVALLYLALALIKDALEVIIAAHVDKSASNLFAIYQTAYRFLPDDIRPVKEKDNQQELKFLANQSQLSAFVAKEGNMGVSTSYTHAHFSEIALWKHAPAETLATALDSIPKLVGTIVIAESTSRGKHNLLYEMWEKATASWDDPNNRGTERPDPWRPKFYSWMDDEEYYLPVGDEFKLSPEEIEFQKQYRATKQQIAWRRAKIKEKASTLGEQGAKGHFDRENPSDPETAFRVVGEIVFEPRALDYMNKHYRRENPTRYDAYLVPDKAVSIGYRPTIVPRGGGPLRIYGKPKPDHDYLMCIDPTRNEGRKPDAAGLHVIDCRTVRVVASYSLPIDPEDLARTAAAIGWYYNEAYAVVESNDAGIGCARVMYKELGYTNMHRHISVGQTQTQYSRNLGFSLKGENRDECIKNGKRFVREYRVEIPDPETLDEMEAFRAVFDKKLNKFKPQGTGEGRQDNLVMALLIGLYIGNIRYRWFDLQPKKRGVPVVGDEADNIAVSLMDELEIKAQEHEFRVEALLGDY